MFSCSILCLQQKLVKKDGDGSIDRTQDVAQLEIFYRNYRNKNKVDELRERERLWKAGRISLNPKE